ncbi:MAG: LPS export ABC transporter periplasmic protein LptC [Gammaproteobacteria bacterium]
MSRHSIFLLVLLVLAFLSWWILTIIDPDSRRQITISQEGPDHFMENFIVTSLDESGTPSHRLKAERLTHYPNEAHSDIIKPVMTFYKKDNTSWVASARTGIVKQDGKEVILYDDVHITRPGDVTTEININTRDLRIVPDQDYAETANSVVIQQNQNTVTATGMEARFARGEIELLSEVRGWYVY